MTDMTLDAPAVGFAQGAAKEDVYTTGREAVSFELRATLFLTAIWVLLLCAMAGWVHPLVLLLCPWLYIRFELYSHELLHCRSGRQLNPMLRWMSVGQSICHMDYDGYRLYHLDHHRHLNTKDDPEYYLESASPWMALLKAMACVEMGAIRYVRLYRREFGWREWTGIALRAALFIGLWIWNWQVFAIYWVTLRLGIGVADFYFHHVLHNDNHRVARAFKALDRRCPWLTGGLLGHDSISILIWHDEHHAYPRVSSRYLSTLAQSQSGPAETRFL